MGFELCPHQSCVNMTLKDAREQVWLNLYSLEYHRLRQDDDKIILALAHVGKSDMEIKQELAKFNERAAILAVTYANEGLEAASSIRPDGNFLVLCPGSDE